MAADVQNVAAGIGTSLQRTGQTDAGAAITSSILEGTNRIRQTTKKISEGT